MVETRTSHLLAFCKKVAESFSDNFSEHTPETAAQGDKTSMMLPLPSTSQQCCTSGRSHFFTVSPSAAYIGGRRLRRGAANGTKCAAMFKNFKNPLRGSSEDAGVYASQGRDDFSADDVEYYFNYMGMLATEGTYDRLNDMLSQGLAPVDLLLLMAAQENDTPRVAELIRAGADLNTKGQDGKTAMEIASDPQIHELLREPAKAATF